MEDKLQMPRWHEGEARIATETVWANSSKTAEPGLENVSLEAVIEVLIKRGICTEAELLAAEDKIRNSDFVPPTIETAPFKPVQTYSAREERHRHRHADAHRLRRWAARYSWSRKIGGFLFGWKWHRKKSE